MKVARHIVGSTMSQGSKALGNNTNDLRERHRLAALTTFQGSMMTPEWLKEMAKGWEKPKVTPTNQ